MEKRSDGKWYTGVATDKEFVVGQGDKADSVRVTIRIIEGEKTGEETSFWLRLGEKSLPHTIKTLRALGWSCNDITTLKGVGDTKARVVYNSRVYQGKTYTDMSAFPFVEREARSDGELRDFAKKYKAAAVEAPPLVVNKANLAPDALPPPRAPSATTTATEPPVGSF